MVYFYIPYTGSLRLNHQNSKFQFQSIVIMKKTAENYRNYNVAEKAHSFQTIKATNPKF